MIEVGELKIKTLEEIELEAEKFCKEYYPDTDYNMHNAVLIGMLKGYYFKIESHFKALKEIQDARKESENQN